MRGKIGILGGIGPEATGEFYSKLIRKLQESGKIKKNTDFPQILINSIPAPELIYTDISDEELEPYAIGIKELDDNNVERIVMVCNTIHLYRDRLQNGIRAPIMDLPKEVGKYLINSGVQKIAIIGTPSTVGKGLYTFDGIEEIPILHEDIEALSDAIYYFNCGDKSQTDIVETIAQRYLDKGAERILLGCTEFAVMLNNSNIPSINTIDVLVDSVIEKL